MNDFDSAVFFGNSAEFGVGAGRKGGCQGCAVDHGQARSLVEVLPQTRYPASVRFEWPYHCRAVLEVAIVSPP